LLLLAADHAALAGTALQSNASTLGPLVSSGAFDCRCAVLSRLQLSKQNCCISAARQVFFAITSPSGRGAATIGLLQYILPATHPRPTRTQIE